jgi:hypothetical protein
VSIREGQRCGSTLACPALVPVMRLLGSEPCRQRGVTCGRVCDGGASARRAREPEATMSYRPVKSVVDTTS